MRSIHFSATAGDQISGWKPRRRPLQPKNSQTSPAAARKPPKQIQIPISKAVDSDKENRPICGTAIAPFDASLAEELVAIRRRLERLRLEREQTERVLKEKDLILEKAMTEMVRRGEEQKQVEMEINKIRRLIQLRDSCQGGPLKSLREQEREKMNKLQAEAAMKHADRHKEEQIESNS